MLYRLQLTELNTKDIDGESVTMWTMKWSTWFEFIQSLTPTSYDVCLFSNSDT